MTHQIFVDKIVYMTIKMYEGVLDITLPVVKIFIPTHTPTKIGIEKKQ